MSFVNLPTRTTNDPNSSTDINTIMENIRVLAGNGTLAPSHSIEDSVPKIPYLTKVDSTPADSINLDWSTSTKRYCLLDRATTIFTFTAPTEPTTLVLVLKQSGTGRLVTWPSGIKWVERTVPALSTVNDYIDIVSFYYDGTSYFGMIGNNFG